MFNGVVDRTLHREVSKKLFKLVKLKHDKLSGLVIMGRQAATALTYSSSAGQHKYINNKVIKLAQKNNGKKLEPIVTKQLTLVQSKLKLDGRAGWDSRLQANRQIPIPLQDKENTGDHQKDGTPHNFEKEDGYFPCPNCGSPAQCNTTIFDTRELDDRMECKCSKSAKALK